MKKLLAALFLLAALLATSAMASGLPSECDDCGDPNVRWLSFVSNGESVHTPYCPTCHNHLSTPELCVAIQGSATCILPDICSICNQTMQNTALNPDNHANMIDWETYDNTQHWRFCLGCGETEIADHDIGGGLCYGTCTVCSCDGFDPDGQHAMSDWMEQSDTQHVRYCDVCYASSTYEVEAHYGGTATCISGALCEDCGSPYGEPDADNHVSMTDWGNFDHDRHYRYCQDCGSDDSYEYEDHDIGGLCYGTCTVCGTSSLNDPNGQHSMTNWRFFSAAQHFRYCQRCDADEYEDHYGGTADCSNRAICEGCNDTYGERDYNTHSMSAWSWQNSWEHRRYCLKCLSAYSYEFEDHYGGVATAERGPICEGCGSEYGKSLSVCTHANMSVWAYYKPTQHSRYCRDCNSPDSYEFEDHDVGGLCAGACTVCGDPAVIDPNGQHVMTDWYYVSAMQHVRHCERCNSSSAVEHEDHYGGAATTESGPICEGCSSEYGEPLCTHANMSEWVEYSATQHYRRCLDCDSSDSGEFEDHDVGGACYGTCTVCGSADVYDPNGQHHIIEQLSFTTTEHFTYCDVCYKYSTYEYEAHYGGTATCSSYAICTACSYPYGELDADNHASISEWGNFDHDRHYRYCLDCGSADSREYEDHDIIGGLCYGTCTVCSNTNAFNPNGQHSLTDWMRSTNTRHFRNCYRCADPSTIEYEDHYGGSGTATCIFPLTCEGCGGPYGEFDTDNHTNMSAWNSYNDTQHYRRCLDCGSKDSYEYESHYGGSGTATCVSGALCEVCGSPYGEPDADNHASMSEWAWDNNTQHYRYCLDCGSDDSYEYEDHDIGGACCGICTVCENYGFAPDGQHALTDWMEQTGTQHFRYCGVCYVDSTIEYEDHYGGTATCSSYAICTACSYPYGELDADNHASISEWGNYNNTQHYRYCPDCENFNSYEFEDHDVGGACYGTCTVCGSDGFAPDGKHSITDWVGTTVTQHFRYCDVCYDYYEYEDHYGGVATCTADGVCTVCSEAYLPATGHDWSKWTSNDNATHTRVCGNDAAHTETDDCSGGVATCTEDGVCTVCKDAYLPATGHDWSKWASNGDGTHTLVCKYDTAHTETDDCSGGTATCISPARCTLCDGTHGEKDPDNHTDESDWLFDSSTQHIRRCEACVQPIEYADHDVGGACYGLCTVCEGYGFAPDGKHSITDWVGTTVTQHFRYCDVCYDYYEYEDHYGGVATCTADGVCTVCSEAYLPATGHDWGKWTSNSDDTHTRVCGNDAAHKETDDCSGGAATCTEDGVCTVCKDAYIPATGHEWSKWTSNGNGTHTRVCQNDEDHTETEDCYGIDATCTTDGVCTDCTAAYIPATGHEWSKWASNGDGTHTRVCQYDAAHTETEDCSGGAATCTEDGVCTVCTAAYIPATGHAWSKWTSNSNGTHTRVCGNDAAHKETDDCSGGVATCTTDGVCIVCKDAYLPATGHAWSAWTSNSDGTHTRVCKNDAAHKETEDCSGGAATCTADGVCTVCKDAYIPATGHDWGEWTSNGDGTHTRVCQNDATHTETEDCYGIDATCTTDGVCTDCKDAYLPATGHDWSKWTSNGDGTHTRVCNNDAAHKATDDCSGGTATCTEDGVCTVCKEAYLPATGHAYTAATTFPACKQPGCITYTCANCGDTYTEAIGALVHWYLDWTPDGNGSHTALCRRNGCGYTATVPCEPITILVNDDEYTVCPVCGKHDAEVFPRLTVNFFSGETAPGELVVRGIEAPFNGTALLFTAAWEYAGRVVPFSDEVTISLSTNLTGVKLLRAEGDTFTEVPFTLDNGVLTFCTDTPGLFLLVSE